MKKLIFRTAAVALCTLASPTFSAHADDMSAKPQAFDTCMQADTPATMSQIYAACMQSSNASDLKRYIINAQLKAKTKTSTASGNTRKMQAEAADARDPNYYYGALALARQAELLLKLEQTQSQKQSSAKLCYYAESAARQSGFYRGELRGHLFEERKTRTTALRKSCEKLPRQLFDASNTVPDTGDLMADILEYKTCLTPVTKDNIFDIYYACHLAEAKTNMLAFRKASSLTGPSYSGSTLAAVYIAVAKIKYRQTELANVLEPKNMEYMCNLVGQVNYYYGQSGETPVAGSADDAMLRNAKKMKTGCKLRNF